MFLKYLTPAILGVALAAGSAVQARDLDTPELYKESQSAPHADPAERAVQPSAELENEDVYKNSQVNPHAMARNRSVMPDAPLEHPELYEESQSEAHAEPMQES